MTRGAPSQRAFTLVEMMVTIGICSLLMGIGVAAYISMNRDLAWHASVSTVTSLLHAARNSATTSRMPVSVIITCDPDPPADFRTPGRERYVCTSLYATFAERIGAWHFEEPDGSLGAAARIEGAFSQKAAPENMEGAELVPGKYGRGIEFLRWVPDDAGYAESLQAVVIGGLLPSGSYRRLPAYDLREGLRISAWIKPELPPEPQADTCYYYPIVAKPLVENADPAAADQQPVYSLMLELDTSVSDDSFALIGGVQVETQGGARLCEIRTEPIIRPGQWTNVAIIYSGAETGAEQNFIRLIVDGEEITATYGLDECLLDRTPTADAAVTGKIARSTLPPRIGSDGVDSFHGVIDEVIFDAITTAERRRPRPDVLYRLWNCETSEPGVYRIDFDRAGRLVPPDDGLPLIALYSAGSPRATLIGVELTGAVKTWSTTQDQVEEQAQSW